ncbi:MAG: hypothetical protein ACTSRO_09860 [Candidatus Heimdallarchaeaceae archaeon]
MKSTDAKEGFPKEFSVFIPALEEEERLILNEYEKNFCLTDSLVKVRDLLVDIIILKCSFFL